MMRSDDGGTHWRHTGALKLSGNYSTSENQVASADGGKTIKRFSKQRIDWTTTGVFKSRKFSRSPDIVIL